MKPLPAAVGRWRPNHWIHTGQRAHVWRASRGNQHVALKVARRPEHQQDLLEEIELLQQVDHPHIARLVDYDPEGKWFATKYIDGPNFLEWLDGRDVDDIVAAGLELASALLALKELGKVHGDLSPANVLMHDGHPVLLDLGAAVTHSRGTPGFAAPERVQGHRASEASDVWGLAALLHSALTGEPVFPESTTTALTAAVLGDIPLPVTATRAPIPERIERLLLSMLTRDPERRPSLAKSIRRLQKASEGEPAKPIVGMVHARRQIRRQIVRAIDGSPTVITVYGRSGSGRRTIVREALQTAIREGAHFISDTAPTAILHAAGQGGVPIAVHRGDASEHHELVKRVLKQPHPALLFLIRSSPLLLPAHKSLLQVSPTPLRVEDAIALAGYEGIDSDRAERLWRATNGLPGALVARFERLHGDGAGLTPRAALVLQRLQEFGPTRIKSLAEAMSWREHEIVDQAEVLLQAGLVELDSRNWRLTAR